MESLFDPAMSGSSDDKTQGIWSLLPSFDPGTDNIREYIDWARLKIVKKSGVIVLDKCDR